MKNALRALCALCLLSSILWAQAEEPKSGPEFDVIKLRNGQELIGKIVKEAETTVTVEFRGGEIRLPRLRIKEIIRADKSVIQKAIKNRINMGRFEERDEFYFVYYRGRRVGWRHKSIRVDSVKDHQGYRFNTRTVYLKDGHEVDMDLQTSEFVDHQLRPLTVVTSENGGGFSSLTRGSVQKGQLKIVSTQTGKREVNAIFFKEGTDFFQPLMRRLADMTHFPDRGETYKIYNSVQKRFERLHASRSLRKEIVAGKHQFVTVWKFKRHERVVELWIDGYGGVVREEIGGPHMVALRAHKDAVMKYSNGEAPEEDDVDLSLEYENVPSGFSLSRPNLTWSFEFPEFDSPVAITLLNPALQSSVDVVVLDRVDKSLAEESVVLDLLSRMKRNCENAEILYQRPDPLAGYEGLRFEIQANRKGTYLRTIGVVTVHDGKGYVLLLAAPSARFDKAKPQFERIIESFQVGKKAKEKAASE